MGMTIAQKIIANHLVDGEMIAGKEIGLRIDQTLTQDATGTMAYLEFESIGIDRVRTELSVAYIDHNTLQSGFENADDHRYIQSVAKKYGLRFSRPGNGICHQVHLERFGIPGKTLIGSDSHTPTGGGIGMLAMGAGGMDVAVAMGGGTYYITMPKIGQPHRSIASVGQCQRYQLGNLADFIRQRWRRCHHRMGWRGNQNTQRSPTCYHYQHGYGTGCNHLHLPLRRNHKSFSGSTGTGQGLCAATK